jgi:hypothetical protein
MQQHPNGRVDWLAVSRSAISVNGFQPLGHFFSVAL